MMMLVVKKASKIVFRGAVIAVATKAAIIVLRKINENETLEAKANESIDKNADKAKRLVKVGVAKTLQLSEMVQEKLEEKKLDAAK